MSISGLLGKKLGMTQIFEGDTAIPVSVIEAEPGIVVRKKNIAADGYNAVQMGFGEKKESRCSKPYLGQFAGAQLKPAKYLKEFRTENPDALQAGQKIGLEVFEKGDLVNVTGTSKGKGFQGIMKRCKARGGPGSHGSTSHRRPGSIGMSSDPSRVFKGHKMPGRMGGVTKTIVNLEVVSVIQEKNLLLIKGAIPGANNGIVVISRTGRKKKAPAMVKAKADTKAKLVKQARKAAAAKKK